MANLRHGIRFGVLALAGTLALSACGHGLPNQGVGQVSVARGTAVLMLVPQVTAGGYRAQAIASNYKKSDINHLLIKVFELQGNAEIPVVDEAGNQVQIDLLNSELDSPLTFNNLNYDTTYRIRCYAYKSPGEDPTNLISTQDASSYSDVIITNDDAPTVAQLKVRLVDIIFNGGFTSGVEVSDGGFISGGTVSITKQTPAPEPTPTPEIPPTRTAYFGEGTAANYLTLVSISQDATPGTYEMRVSEIPGSYGIFWGERMTAFIWIEGQQVTIEGSNGEGTLVVELGALPNSFTDYVVIN